jgi:hypothetical protein
MRYMRSTALAVLACGLTAVTTPCLAQATPGNLRDDIELTRSAVQSRRQEIVKELMELTPQESEAFWPIYREYQVDAAKLGDQRVALIETYFANADKLTDEQADKLLEDAFKLRKNQLDLQKKYVGKYRKVLPAVKVARLYQIENVLDAIISANLQATMPMIGDTTQRTAAPTAAP